MKQYLLDTNICIFQLKGKFDLKGKLAQVGYENCFISEITFAELQFGVECSQNREKNQLALDNFLSEIAILPIFKGLGLFAKEKARLRKEGKIIDDFDLLIGSTAIAYDLIMVTNNINHFERIQGIVTQDWTNPI